MKSNKAVMNTFKGGRIVKSSFRAFPALKNNHLQTLWPTLIRSTPKISTSRERLETPDDDFIDIDWYGKKSNPLVILIHGLASSSKAKYILGLQKALAKKNFASVAMNLRGCSGVPNKRMIGYHGGATDDLDFLINILNKRFPNRPLAVVGYSLGASILLNWLAEKKAKSKLFAAVSVSAPLQLDLATERLQQGFSKVYEQYLLTFMKLHQFKKNLHLYDRLDKLSFDKAKGKDSILNTSIKLKTYDQIDLSKLKLLPSLRKIKTIYDFDDKITAPVHGFSNATEYYRTCSSKLKLNRIKTPTLIIHAKDDPFMPFEIIPKEDELSSSVMIELSENGGHVGFISKDRKNKPTYWIDSRVPFFLNQILNNDP